MNEFQNLNLLITCYMYNLTSDQLKFLLQNFSHGFTALLFSHECKQMTS